MADNLDLSEYVSLAEAARRLPSPRPGKKTHLSTIYRLIAKHRLPVIRRGSYRFVRWADVLDLFTAERRYEPAPRRPSGVESWARRGLEARGIRVP